MEINKKHIKFVENVARGYNGYGLPMEDIIQSGYVGLLKAHEKYDQSKNDNFFGYAIWHVRSEIHEYVMRNFHEVFIPKSKPLAKLFFNFRKLRKESGYLSESELESIAERLGVTIEDVRTMNSVMSNGKKAYRLFHEPEENERSMDDLYLADRSFSPEELVMEYQEEEQKHQQVEAALSVLNDRQRDIVESRLLIENDEKPVGLKELGEKYGVSFEAIRQNEKRAINKMRESFAA